MSETKFTPGPWRHVFHESGSAIYMGVAPHGPIEVQRELVYAHGLYGSEDTFEELRQYEEAWANGNLMAAAPDLYRALEEACELHYSANGTKPPKKWLMALKKARGES